MRLVGRSLIRIFTFNVWSDGLANNRRCCTLSLCGITIKIFCDQLGSFAIVHLGRTEPHGPIGVPHIEYTIQNSGHIHQTPVIILLLAKVLDRLPSKECGYHRWFDSEPPPLSRLET